MTLKTTDEENGNDNGKDDDSIAAAAARLSISDGKEKVIEKEKKKGKDLGNEPTSRVLKESIAANQDKSESASFSAAATSSPSAGPLHGAGGGVGPGSRAFNAILKETQELTKKLLILQKIDEEITKRLEMAEERKS